MIKIKVPASSANLGTGFDCFGLAVNVYNTFLIEPSDRNILEGVEERYNNEDNLFLRAYRKGCEAIGVQDCIRAIIQADIPVSRGMGSSAAMIAGGLFAANALHNHALSKDQLFQLSSEMEGHPDNAAPCIFGGMSISRAMPDGSFITKKINFDPSFQFTLFVPDFEVTTESARAAMPDQYSKAVAAGAIAKAVFTIKALEEGNMDLLKMNTTDEIHEPYRRRLIHEFDDLAAIAETDTDGKLLVSGSGSTCLLIAKKRLSTAAKEKIGQLKHHWQILETMPAENGIEEEDYNG